MLKDGKATQSAAYNVLVTLQTLTEEAHLRNLAYTPANLPVLRDLNEVPPELVDVPCFKSKGKPKQAQRDKPIAGSAAMSRFDAFRELTESIAESQTPQVLYALSVDVSALKCLMDGLGSKARSLVKKIVVHGWYHDVRPCPANGGVMFPEMIARRLQLLLLEEISEGVGYGEQVPLDFYRMSRQPDIYGLMYGEGAIYYGGCRDCPSFFAYGDHIDFQEYREIGTPMYKLNPSRSLEYQKHKTMLMYGTVSMKDRQATRPDQHYPIVVASRQ